MKSRPILFSAQMVRAVLDGKKSQTRRVIRADIVARLGLDHVAYAGRLAPHVVAAPIKFPIDACPHGHAGDRLWVRETHAQFMVGEGMDSPVPQCVAYRATCDADGGFDYPNGRGEVMRLKVTKWTPSIFMPRWASRITLEITEVRVQRLQEISDDDARAEGVHRNEAAVVFQQGASGFDKELSWTARGAFACLWDKINGRATPMLDDEGAPMLDNNERPLMHAPKSWASNPYVWAIAFKRVS